jgi:hypothetical protein
MGMMIETSDGCLWPIVARDGSTSALDPLLPLVSVRFAASKLSKAGDFAIEGR